MREIVLDTETTGLDPAEGHRIVEIGAVELFNHMKTGRTFHVYIDPERPMPLDAFRIHGLGDEFLRGKPRFAQIARDFIDFIAVDRLVIHNAAFDMAMINAEFGRLGIPRLPPDRALDTIQLARQRFPGAQASLDALCKRFGIDLSVREKHGALLDCELLAEVYLELLGGRQHGLGLDIAGPGCRAPGTTVASRGGTSATAEGGGAAPQLLARPRPAPLPSHLTAEEEAAHRAFVEELGEAALWRRSG